MTELASPRVPGELNTFWVPLANLTTLLDGLDTALFEFGKVVPHLLLLFVVLPVPIIPFLDVTFLGFCERLVSGEIVPVLLLLSDVRHDEIFEDVLVQVGNCA